MEQNAKPIRWGIIGLGRIAHKFAQDLLTVEGGELHAVASRSYEKAKAFASEYHVEKAYGTYEALANDPQIDAVYIATPHVLHKDNSIMCLRNGKAVLCEKPFAMNLEEVSEMISVAREEKVLLMEALWTYFLPHYQHALELVKSKSFGNILKLEADFGFYREFNGEARLFKKSLGGGSLLDIGIYPIFAALTFLGMPLGINAKATFFDNGVDSSCTMTFQYPEQVTANLRSSIVESLPTEAIIHCEKATIKLNTEFHTPSSVTILTNGSEETKQFPCKTFGYSFEIDHFNQLLRDGKIESEVMTFEFSQQLIKTLDQVRDSIGLHYH